MAGTAGKESSFFAVEKTIYSEPVRGVMTVKSVISAAAVLVLLSGNLPSLYALDGKGAPSANAPFLLEQKYNRETKPKNRVKIAINLTDVRLQLMRSAYDTMNSEKEKEAIGQYLSAVDLLVQAVRSASDTGYSKRAEIHMRRHERELQQLKMSLSVMDRASVEKAAGKVTSLREEILYSIMNPRDESARK